MKVDLHVHTRISSPCSFIEPGPMIEAARAAGLDGVCVTEHDEIRGAEVAARLGKREGFKVFRGIEVFTELGDMLVYGLYRDATSWKMPFDLLVRLCRDAGAALVPAHPCRTAGEYVRTAGDRIACLLESVDAIETHNGGCMPEGNRAALELAASAMLPGTGGSDAHHLFQIGRCYTLFEDRLETDEDLVQALKRGRCRGEYLTLP